MAHDKENAIRDMVDFDVRLKASELKEGHYHVEAELRAAEAEVYDEITETVLKVSAQRIILRFDMEGLEVAPGVRQHDVLRTVGPSTKTVDKSEFKASGSASSAVSGRISAEAPSASAELSIKGEGSVATSRTVEATAETAERYVIARPGDRWEIMEAEGRPLNATYLTSETPLCIVKAVKGANKLGITATAEIMERDLKIDMLSAKNLLGKMSLTKKKLTGIIIAKSLAASIDGKYSGKIIVSRVETEVED